MHMRFSLPTNEVPSRYALAKSDVTKKFLQQDIPNWTVLGIVLGYGISGKNIVSQGAD